MIMKKCVRKLCKQYKKQVLASIFRLSQKDVEELSMYSSPLKKGDKLFVESNNPNDPKLVMSSANDIYFEQGYASTAVFLLNTVEYSKNYLKKDSYVYPALFCLRMYLEIIMKLILSNYEIKFSGNGHTLMKSWEKVKEIIDEKSNDEQIETVEKLLVEIDAFDPMATAFRYPGKLNKRCEKHNSDMVCMLVDIKILRERFLQLYRFFDGLYDLSIISNEKS